MAATRSQQRSVISFVVRLATPARTLKLSERDQLEPRWLDAARYVLKAVEERPFIFFARMAVYKAVHRTDQEMPPAPDVRKPNTWRERRRARKKGTQ